MSSPAIAAVLENYDILCLLFDGSRGPQGALSNCDLGRCALVSRAFSKAALRALWRNLPDLLPLWHVLAPPGLPFPLNHRALPNYFDEIDNAALHKEPTQWARLVGYARHIHSVSTRSYVQHRSAELLQRILLQWQESGAGRPLFPVLQSLQLSFITCSIPSLVALFGAPSLRNLIIAFNDMLQTEEPDLAGVMYNIATAVVSLQHMSSRLRCLSIEKPEACMKMLETRRLDLPPGIAESLLLHHVPGLRHLQSVTLWLPYAIPPSMVRPIAAIPTLAYLSLHNVIGDPESGTIQKVTSLRLRVLRLNGTSAGLMVALTGLYAPELRSLKLETADLECTPQDLVSCLEAAANAVNPDVFRQFSAVLEESNSAGWYPLPEPLQLASILRPFMSLHALRSFELASRRLAFASSDADLAELFGGCRWTKLDEFNIGNISWSRTGDVPSPRVLYHIRACCRNLRILTLPYLSIRDPASSTGTLFDAAAHFPEHHPLQSLRIGDFDSFSYRDGDTIPDETTMSWACYIHGLFPLLKLGPGWSSSYHAVWEEVLEFLSSVQKGEPHRSRKTGRPVPLHRAFPNGGNLNALGG
ncbi:hypothetical protein C8T65DRAFT_743582 [Cerioporus squamosus]|nr:hypothetical protein C8T65DRAFT_743582 [Cerioporus squamosus]